MQRADPHLDRRHFLGLTAAAGAAALRPALRAGARVQEPPPHLRGHAELFARDPRAAAVAWFAEARFGLFMHYGLYALLGRGEWVMFRERIPVEQYAKLQQRFAPDAFDADRITDLALQAGMRYVNMTSRHHDGFCLFHSAMTEFTSVRCPARRDLVGELAEQCQRKGLGLFLYYSYALDWRHPWYYSRAHSDIARPDYVEPDPAYRWQRDADFARYIDYVHAQLRELLTGYGPLAGLWFDPIMGFYARPDLFPVTETYALVRALQPHCLISFKQGATGTEDFAAPERHGRSLADNVQRRFGDPERTRVAAAAWEANRDKHNEICDTLQPGVWGYRAADDGNHRGADETWTMLRQAGAARCNLLLNTGPLPDGSLHSDDVATLHAVGRRIAAEGYPSDRAARGLDANRFRSKP
ncbi:MAG: alpha-L-fucosidase [Planctomycetes bacterium]|nr:alpha-L-fucosidase [Planctomycetota bacterium]